MRLFSRSARQKPAPPEPKPPPSLFPKRLEPEESPAVHAERIARNQFGDHFCKYDLAVRRISRNTLDGALTLEALNEIKNAVENYAPGSHPHLADLLSLLNQYAEHHSEFKITSRMLEIMLETLACALRKIDSLRTEPEIQHGLNSKRLLESQISHILENLAHMLKSPIL